MSFEHSEPHRRHPRPVHDIFLERSVERVRGGASDELFTSQGINQDVGQMIE